MTKEEKKDRRRARHELQQRFRRDGMRKMGLYSTTPQIKAGIRILVDRYIAGMPELELPPLLPPNAED